MAEFELASVLENVRVIDLACKTNANVKLSEDEEVAVATLDAWAKEIGKTGHDKDHQIAQFIQREIQETFDNYPSELLSQLFDIGSIGEDDRASYYTEPKNTLRAIEAAPGGNVERSFLDISSVTPTYTNLQVETDISMVDLRRNGWKSVARLSQYAIDALNNKMFKVIFDAIDAAITSGNNFIDLSSSSATVTTTAMNTLSLYLHDFNEGGGAIVALSKFIQQISKLSGFTSFLSEQMKDTLYRTGELPMFDGIPMYRIASYKYLNGDGSTPLIKDKRVYGIAGKIGAIDMIGDVRIMEQEDINNENVHLKIAGFKFGRSFYNTALEKCVKMALQ